MPVHKIRATGRTENGKEVRMAFETTSDMVYCSTDEETPRYLPLDEVLNNHADEINDNTTALNTKEPLLKNAPAKPTPADTDAIPLVDGGDGATKKIQWSALRAALPNLNLLINSSLAIWQRGTSFAAPNNIYTADRMRCNGSGTVSKHNNGMQITGTVTVMYIMEADDFNKISGKTVTSSYSIDGIISTNTFIASSATVVNLTLTNCTLNWLKLEHGSVATPFVPRSYGEELALCQRYYENSYTFEYTPSPDLYSESGSFWAVTNAADATLVSASVVFKCSKRAVPTVTILSCYGEENAIYAGGDIYTTSYILVHHNGISKIYVTDPMPPNLYLWFHWTADAEIY